jgi:hypothetical protein
MRRRRIRSLVALSSLGWLTLGGCGARVSPGEAADATTDTTVDTSLEVATDIYSCSAQNDCVLAPDGCCGGPCGMPELKDYTAVNRRHTTDFAKITCPPTDAPSTCPGCVLYPNPNLFARCTPSGCVGVDLRTDSLSGCSTDADCRIRYPGCCESCGGPPTSLMALRKDAEGELLKTICDASGTPCPPCVPSYPAGASAMCDPGTRHCVVLLPK